MSLVVLERGNLSFGPQVITTDLNLRIGAGDKVGLVGANGSGKSTLLRVLAGEQSLDSGRVHWARGCRIGYLPQDVTEVVDDTVLGSVLAAVPGRSGLEEELERVRASLEQSEDPDEQMSLARQLADLSERLEQFELFYSEHRARRILGGLGFGEQDMDRPAAELSGGWRMRAALAGLLFQSPDLLFLDEPTNHLDIPSVVWFDQFLTELRNAIVLICHDREFLNRHIERVISFEPEGVRLYSGDFEAYRAQRAAEEEVLEARARNRERQVRELDRFVQRFKAKATKARQAQSRAKQLEKLSREIERPVPRPRRLQFQFPPTARTGRDVLTLDGLRKAYGAHVLFDGLSRGVYAGDRLAIIGPNGVGKTTLLKMMAGEIAPDAGAVRYGSGVDVGYFAQHHAELLDPGRTVLEEVWQVCPRAGESFVRGVCGAFLFSGDDVEKRVSVLSGGERARVLLARLLAAPGNLLLMDEPTTHLDINAAEALAEALAGFDGTLVFVSHNTSFVNRLATKVWDVVEADVVEYPGNLAEYLEHQERRAAAEAAARAAAGRGEGAADSATAAGEDPARGAGGETRQERQERKRREARQRNAVSRQTRPLRRAVEELEQRITGVEEEQAELEARLGEPELHADQPRYLEALGRYEDNKRALERLYRQWEARGAELEELTAQLDADSG